eukprot:11699386-Heterocapsa_arctica.AAC.1
MGTRGTTAVRWAFPWASPEDDGGRPSRPQFRRAHCRPPAPPAETLTWSSSRCTAATCDVHCGADGGLDPGRELERESGGWLGREGGREGASSGSKPMKSAWSTIVSVNSDLEPHGSVKLLVLPPPSSSGRSILPHLIDELALK